ncbi:adenosylcobalamin-dependent ribonucleoside-diphosphate reductase [Candidatus Aenigmatarchaeota archaeon]
MSIIKIRKRDGRIVDFRKEKITNAVFKAALSVGGSDKSIAENLSDQVLKITENRFSDTTPSVEDIQDIVEKVLIEGGHAKTAKEYILYRERHRQLREEKKKILGGRVSNLPFSVNALQVIAKRYLVKDLDGNITETPEGMFSRVADALSNVELNYGKSPEKVEELKKEFENVMLDFEFTPAGRTLANAGGPTRLVSNCIVLHIDDSMDGIFETLKNASLLQQAGSGLGFPFHLLRPAGSVAKKSRGVASGPVSFLHVYNKAFGVIKQQNRHGANMGIMRVDHPDILEFVHAKNKEGDLRNFNLSIGLTNDFMEKVKNSDPNPWMCSWKGNKMKPRRIYRDVHGVVTDIREEIMTARELFQEIITCAWKTGEPGCVFLDRVNETNPLPGVGQIEACNPCGEQFLHDADVCNLGSLNLENFVSNRKVDFEKLRRVTRTAIRMLDNVVDLTDFPVEKVNRTFKSNRRIGLGIMGFADMLYLLRIPYNSDEGRETAEAVVKCINDSAHEMSRDLGEEKGAFPNWEKSKYKEKGIKMRNAALTTIAPTGTISMVFDVSGGVEPYFALAYYYKGILGGSTQLHYVNKHLKEALQEHGIYSEEIMDKICKKGSLKDISEIPEELKRVFVTAMDISAEDHIKMQATFQKNIDNSISKTVNFPQQATKEDVLNGYILAWQLGCKGCTVYRDKSREEQVLNLNTETAQEDTTPDIIAAAVESDTVVTTEPDFSNPSKITHCPECKIELVKIEGCMKCQECGWGLCGG